VTEFNESIQHGIQAHSQSPTTHSTPAKIQAIGPGSESVLVRICA